MFTAVVQGTAHMSGAWTPVALLSACVIVSSSGSHSWSHPKKSEIRSKYLLLTEMLVVSTSRHSSLFFNTLYHCLSPFYKLISLYASVYVSLCAHVISIINETFFYLTSFVFVWSCVNLLHLLCEYNVMLCDMGLRLYWSNLMANKLVSLYSLKYFKQGPWSKQCEWANWWYD